MWRVDIRIDPEAGTIECRMRRGRQDEMVGWHIWLNGHELEQAPGDGEGQKILACCSPWGCRVRHNWVTDNNKKAAVFVSCWRLKWEREAKQAITYICYTGKVVQGHEALYGSRTLLLGAGSPCQCGATAGHLLLQLSPHSPLVSLVSVSWAVY